jgi:hypothetical protein
MSKGFCCGLHTIKLLFLLIAALAISCETEDFIDYTKGVEGVCPPPARMCG